MQTQEPQKFRLNSQVFLVLGLVLIALGLPVALLISGAMGIFRPSPKAELPPEALAPLQQSLEDAANKNLTPISLESTDNQRSVTIESTDVAKELARIASLAKSISASSLPADHSNETQVRVLIHVPKSQVEAFLAACRENRSELPSAGTENEAGQLVEVIINKKVP